jgi:hypothetical protein
MTLKAIETAYDGRLFRSRLEARWAVFFRALGMRYVYEPEGYDLDGTWYLPDFYLPFLQLFVEIKPDEPSDDEQMRCAKLARATGRNVVLLSGQPSGPEWHDDQYWLDLNYTGIGYYGKSQQPFDGDYMYDYHTESLVEFLRENDYNAPSWNGSIDTWWQIIEMDRDYYRKSHGREHPHWKFGPACKGLVWAHTSGGYKLQAHHGNYEYCFHTEQLLHAYEAAQSARFEVRS